jgi:hypothetical protein
MTDDVTIFLLGAFFSMYAIGLAAGLTIHAIKSFMEKI